MLMLSLLKNSCDTQWVSDGYPLGIMKKTKKKTKKIQTILTLCNALGHGHYQNWACLNSTSCGSIFNNVHSLQHYVHVKPVVSPFLSILHDYCLDFYTTCNEGDDHYQNQACTWLVPHAWLGWVSPWPCGVLVLFLQMIFNCVPKKKKQTNKQNRACTWLLRHEPLFQ
jgi:hypothetical protein